MYNARNNKRKHEVMQQSFVQRVDSNKKLFTKRQRKDAALAYQAQCAFDIQALKILCRDE